MMILFLMTSNVTLLWERMILKNENFMVVN